MIFIVELLIVCAVMLILAAVAFPNLLQMRISENQAAARKQVVRVLDAISSVNICGITTGCNPAPVQPLIPAPGTITQGGYTFTFQQAGTTWSYVAVPVAAGFSGHQSYFVNQDGILRCGIDATAAPC